MAELKEIYIDVLEEHGWDIINYTEDGDAELRFFSPAGEDFSICLDTADFPRAVAEYAENFDPNEHAEMWVRAGSSGVTGIPPASVLVWDAEDIKKALTGLAEALAKEVSEDMDDEAEM